jgi:hypothetical protein
LIISTLNKGEFGEMWKKAGLEKKNDKANP